MRIVFVSCGATSGVALGITPGFLSWLLAEDLSGSHLKVFFFSASWLEGIAGGLPERNGKWNPRKEFMEDSVGFHGSSDGKFSRKLLEVSTEGIVGGFAEQKHSHNV